MTSPTFNLPLLPSWADRTQSLPPPPFPPGGEAVPCLLKEGSAVVFIHSLTENREAAFSSARYYRMTRGGISYQGKAGTVKGGGDLCQNRVVTGMLMHDWKIYKAIILAF